MYSQEALVKEVKVHAILASIGLLILFPLSLRLTYWIGNSGTRAYLYSHLVFQVIIAGSLIITGFALGVHVTQVQAEEGLTRHFDDHHKKIGLALFILYVSQVFTGVLCALPFPFVTFPATLLHFASALAIAGMTFYQVHNGITVEYPAYVKEHLPPSVGKAWKGAVIGVCVGFSISFGCSYRCGRRKYSHDVSMSAEVDLS